MKIWYEEVDTSLIEHINNVFSNQVKVIFLNPELVNTNEEYPCITLSRYNEGFNDKRTNYNSFKVEDLDSTNAKIIFEPTMYDFYYQVDIWAKSRTELNALVRSWRSVHRKKYHTLNVLDTEGDIYLSTMKEIDFRDLSTMEAEDNIFRYSFSYQLGLEIEGETLIKPKLSSINLIKEEDI